MRDYSTLDDLYHQDPATNQRLETVFTEDILLQLPPSPEQDMESLLTEDILYQQIPEASPGMEGFISEELLYQQEQPTATPPAFDFHSELLAEDTEIDEPLWRSEFHQHRLDTWDMQKGYQLAHDFRISQGLTEASTQKDFYKQVFSARGRIEWDLEGRVVGPNRPWNISDPTEPQRRPWKQDLWRGFALARDTMKPFEQQAVDKVFDQQFNNKVAFNGIEFPDNIWWRK